MRLKVALIQMSAGPEKGRNVAKACERIDEAAREGADFVLLPEVFSFVGDVSVWREAAEPIPGPTTDALAERAREHGIHVLGGSILERRPDGKTCNNTSFLIDPSGKVLATYRKMHLFTVRLPDGAVFNEIDHTTPGDEAVVVDTTMGRVGMTICYDLRFGELYRLLTLRGAHIITVPSAFTAFTGAAHWKELLRARAIENQVFLLAANQTGRSATGVEFYGHSLVVDPWGTVLAEAGEDEELLLVDIDTSRVEEVRRRLGALDHVRRDLLRHLGEWEPQEG